MEDLRPAGGPGMLDEEEEIAPPVLGGKRWVCRAAVDLTCEAPDRQSAALIFAALAMSRKNAVVDRLVSAVQVWPSDEVWNREATQVTILISPAQARQAAAHMAASQKSIFPMWPEKKWGATLVVWGFMMAGLDLGGIVRGESLWSWEGFEWKLPVYIALSFIGYLTCSIPFNLIGRRRHDQRQRQQRQKQAPVQEDLQGSDSGYIPDATESSEAEGVDDRRRSR